MPGPEPGAGWRAHRPPPQLRSPQPRPFPRPLHPPPPELAPRAARSRRPLGAAPRRLLSFQPRWRRAAKVWAPSRSMSGSCRRSRAPIPPAWGPPSGKALISLGLELPRSAARQEPGAGRPDRWCARRRAGAVRGGGLGPRPGWGGAEGVLHLSARPASAAGAVTAQAVGVATAAPLTPGAAIPPSVCCRVLGLPGSLFAAGLKALWPRPCRERRLTTGTGRD